MITPPVRFWLGAAIVIAALASTVSPASSDNRDFPFTYSYQQEARGEHEIAYHIEATPRLNHLVHELEFEYGITSRFSIAPYLKFQQGDGRSMHFDAGKVEMRGRLGNFGYNRLLVGLYLELEQPVREPLEIEGRAIFSSYSRRGANLSLNYVLTRQLATGAQNSHVYSVGYAVPTGQTGLRGGLEWIHELATGKINAGPDASYTFGTGIHVAAGIAFPISKNDDNRCEVRAIAQYHY